MTRRKSVQVDFGKGFLGTTDAAAALGLSVTSIQKMVSAGVLKAFRTSGGHRRISIESVSMVAEQMGVPWKDRIVAAPVTVHAATSAAAAVEGAQPVIGSTSVEILLVDDGSATLHPIAKLIERRNGGVHCVVVSDSVEALVWTTEKQPDLVVTELTVKPLDGFGLLKAIRGSPRLHQVGLVVVTSLSAEEIARRGGLPDGVVVYHQPLPCERLAGFLDALLHMRDRLAA
jgi:excisionase family DNA binding protein